MLRFLIAFKIAAFNSFTAEVQMTDRRAGIPDDSPDNTVLTIGKWLLGWFYVPKKKIDSTLRRTFEQYGTFALQVLLGTNTDSFQHNGAMLPVEPHKQEAVRLAGRAI